MEHIKWSHPFRVTLGKIVVHGNNVNTVSCKCIEEYRQCSHKGLTFTCCHFCNLTLMEYCTTEELYIVMYHLPFQIISTSCPVVVINSIVTIDSDKVFLWIRSQLTVEVSSCHHSLFVLGKAACCIFDDSKSYRHHLVERLFKFVECFLFKFIYLMENRLTLINRSVFDGSFQFCYFLLLLVSVGLNIFLYLLTFCSQFIVAQLFYLWINRFYFLYKRLDKLHVACRLIAEHRFQEFV